MGGVYFNAYGYVYILQMFVINRTRAYNLDVFTNNAL